MRNCSVIMKSVASLLIVTVPFLPIHAYANDNEAANAGREAQTFANELSASFKSNQGGVSNGNISFPTIQNGQFQSGGEQLMSMISFLVLVTLTQTHRLITFLTATRM